MFPKSKYADNEVYVTKDESGIRELMHPQQHGNKNQSLAEATVPPGVTTLLHKHAITEEIYFITKGTGRMTLGDNVFDVEKGDSICISPGQPHQIKNTSDTQLVFLCCCSPAYSHEDTELLMRKKAMSFMRKIIIPVLIVAALFFLSVKSDYLGAFSDRVFISQEGLCWDSLENYRTEAGRLLTAEIEAYQSMVEESLMFRAISIKLAKNLKTKIKNDQPLSGDELDIMNQGLVDHLELRKNLYKVAESHECWINLRRKDLARFNLNKSNQLQGVMLSLSAGLMLYDNYLLAISIFEEDEKLRRILNAHDNGYRKSAAELTKVTLSYNSISNRRRMRNGMKFYEKHIKKLNESEKEDIKLDYLDVLISQSPSYKLVREYSPFYVLSNKISFMSSVSNDVLQGVSSEGVNMFSMLFGNTVGLIETRKGKLYGKTVVQNSIESTLKAGDILLEKTPFRLTDKFIPGHWGHAAIWLGTETELKTLGIWEHPVVKQYHDQIRNGNSVVEALRAGVEMTELNKFLNIDDLGVFRLRDRTNDEIARVLILALRQVGKDYDFNFDVETTDRIVCSELIYITYTSVPWPTDNTLGRHTISPDNIAEKVFRQGPLELVSLIHDGKIHMNKPYEKLQSLMEYVPKSE